MARRRKHAHKKHHTRKRHSKRMGAIADQAKSGLAIIGGAIAAQFVINQINSMTSLSASTQKIVKGAAPLALGFILPKISKSTLVKDLGLGMIAVGGMELIKDNTSGFISGMPHVAGPYSNKAFPKRLGANPTIQNPRGTIAGLDARKAGIMTA